MEHPQHGITRDGYAVEVSIPGDSSSSNETQSLWHSQDAGPHVHDAWSQRADAYDTVVVGGGLTGVVTALLATRAGQRVALIEARDIGAVTTGNTTGKISVLQGTRLSQIARRHSQPVTQAYADANLAAQDWLVDYCAHVGLTTEAADAYTYAESAAHTRAVDAEYRACRGAGLPARLVRETGLPYAVAAAVLVPNQVQFDPMPMLRAAVQEIRGLGGDVFTHLRVRTVRTDSSSCTVVTGDGDVRTDHVVLATGIPILDRGGFFARLEPDRSYAGAFELPGEPPEGMYLSVDTPTRSLRTAPRRAGRLLLVGGNGHVVGRHGSTSAAVADLTEWTRQRFPGARRVSHWSAQDYSTPDELPYVGFLLPDNDRVSVATGYGKWGMTNSVAAAHLTAMRIIGSPDPQIESWGKAFTAWSVDRLFDAPGTARFNAAVGLHLACGWWDAATSTAPSDPPAEGQGRVVRERVRPVGVCTVNGTTHRVGAVCPHLGGVLRWNDAERSWDCPLHGSRFDADGTLLEGPATGGLSSR